MELLPRAKAVRLRSHHDKYLYADDDEIHVVQDRDATSTHARWSVELVDGSQPPRFRFRSRYGRYLTASAEAFLLGVTGRKVVQTSAPSAATEWEPVKDGGGIRLKTRDGTFLRANGGLPPWRNSVTHDFPSRSGTQEPILIWALDILEVAPRPANSMKKPAEPQTSKTDDSSSEGSYRSESTGGIRTSSSTVRTRPPSFQSRTESDKSSQSEASVHKVEGRAIHCHIAKDDGRVDEAFAGYKFTFDGSSLEELADKLEEVTGFHDLIICTRNKLTGRLIPLRLQLPPNNAPMYIIAVHDDSTVAGTLSW